MLTYSRGLVYQGATAVKVRHLRNGALGTDVVYQGNEQDSGTCIGYRTNIVTLA